MTALAFSCAPLFLQLLPSAPQLAGRQEMGSDQALAAPLRCHSQKANAMEVCRRGGDVTLPTLTLSAGFFRMTVARLTMAVTPVPPASSPARRCQSQGVCRR